MTLSAGTRLGPYEILAPLGAGGMGEVYRARDPKLARDVAVKVLPEGFLEGEEGRERFEREAKLLATLNHPNIAAVYSFEEIPSSSSSSSSSSVPVLVMELLEGESLRTRLAQGPFAPRRATELAIQMARGPRRGAREGRRPPRPEAREPLDHEGRPPQDPRLRPREAGGRGRDGSESYAPTAARPAPGLLTERGMILGTLGYMSPEQVRGEAVDARSDIFSFGVVLFEMLTARRAFARDTRERHAGRDPARRPSGGRRHEPAHPSRTPRDRRTTASRSNPRQRFHSAHDLGVRAAEPVVGGGTRPRSRLPSLRRTGGRRGSGALSRRRSSPARAWRAGRLRGRPAPLPTFRPLTHERGTLSAARFVPNSPEIVYSAQWAGGASQWYRAPPGPARHPPAARRARGSSSRCRPTGDGIGLARPYLSHGVQVGTLFGLPLAGGAQREWVSSGVWGACQGSQSGELAAVIGEYSGEIRLEWPLGRVVYKGLDILRSPRIRGDLLAFFQEQGDLTEDGNLNLVDRSGKVRLLTAVKGFTGLAWGPRGDEVWISTYRDGESRLLAAGRSGRDAHVAAPRGATRAPGRGPAGARPRGAPLLPAADVRARPAANPEDRDLGWLDAQATMGLTADGSAALLAPLGEWSRVDGTLYLRPLSGGARAGARPRAAPVDDLRRTGSGC